MSFKELLQQISQFFKLINIIHVWWKDLQKGQKHMGDPL